MSNATKLAHAVLRQLIEAGVSDFVVSPGSRNAPLLTALGEAAQKQIIDLHVKIDERGAAFFALGISNMLPLFAPVELQLPTFIQLPSKLCTVRINC